MMLKPMSLAQRVERIVLTKAAGGCDCWRSKLRPRPDGYVRTAIHCKMIYAHRLAFEAFRGPVPVGFELDHLCRNRWCINPDHLEVVTRAINMARSVARCSKLTHCKQGHPLFGKNVYSNSGRRHCRACRTQACRRHRA